MRVQRRVIFLVSIVVVIIIIILIRYLKNNENYNNDSKLYCNNDSDCTTEICCHADSCVAKHFAPKCSEAICTQECRPGTLDCGQARCACVNNKCLMERLK